MNWLQYFLFFSALPFSSIAQSPITQIEGFLEVYHPIDTTSLYIGQNAGQAVDNSFYRFNTFVGSDAGRFNTTGFNNDFFGLNAGRSNTTGNNNAFFGNSAGFNNTTGIFNAFFGTAAGWINTNGSFNAFFGQSAGRSNTIGSDNAFFGQNTGRSNTTGSDNTFFGQSAGSSNTTGSDNAFFGDSAGLNNTSGSNNTFLGNSAGLNSQGDGNTFIGSLAGPPSGQGNVSNRLFINNQQSTNPLIYGEFDNDLITINHKAATSGSGHLTGLRINNIGGGHYWTMYTFTGDGTLGFYKTGDGNEKFIFKTNGDFFADGSINGSSDVHRKEAITSINYNEVLNKITQIPITEWQYKGSEERHIGPMAQDFYAAFGLGLGETTIATVDADGVALAAIKALALENEKLRDINTVILERLQVLERKLEELID